MDKLTPELRTENMRRIRSKDMKPELLVRRLVHSLGYRYRLHRKDLPGKHDLVFGPRHKVIFVHGCFWHMHPDPNCADARMPKSNTDYWKSKLERNVERDKQHIDALYETGWKVLTIWECELKNLEKVKQHIVDFLDPKNNQPV